MLAAIALTPSAPVLVPELAGAAAEVVPFRSAAVSAVTALPDRWIAVGVGPAEGAFARLRGTFAGYGVDVPVALCPPPCPEFADLPLCALVAGWLREQANPTAAVEVRVYPAGWNAGDALACGRALRAEIDRIADPIGVLVVADGANTLTESAPGGFDPDALVAQAGLDAALAAGDPGALAGVPEGIVGRVAYQVLAGLAEPGPVSARELLRGAPYGVGYFIGVWQYARAGDPVR